MIYLKKKRMYISKTKTFSQTKTLYNMEKNTLELKVEHLTSIKIGLSFTTCSTNDRYH